MQLSKVAVFTLVNLTGCGAHVDGSPSAPGAGAPLPQPRAAESTAALAEVDQNLARLRSLNVFEVGELVVNLPAEATNCYDICPGFESVAQALRAQAAERLANLADAAGQAAATPYVGYACSANIDANLEALRSLEVVGVGAFIRSLPENNPRCYSQPCPEDVDAANAKNEARAAELESIALAAQEI
jgi:hypothetical protein